MFSPTLPLAAIPEFVGTGTIEDVINLMQNKKTLKILKKEVKIIHPLKGDILLTKDPGIAHIYEIQPMEPRHQKEVIQ